MTRSHEVSKPRDSTLDFFIRSEIWQAPRQQRCRDSCKISERCAHHNIQSRGFETPREAMRLTAKWIEALLLCCDLFCCDLFCCDLFCCELFCCDLFCGDYIISLLVIHLNYLPMFLRVVSPERDQSWRVWTNLLERYPLQNTTILEVRVLQSPAICGLLTKNVKLRVVHAPGMSKTFSSPLRVSDPGMHHGTCVTVIRQEAHGNLT